IGQTDDLIGTRGISSSRGHVWRGVHGIEIVVVLEVWIQCECQQTCIVLVGDEELIERIRQQCAVLDYPNFAGPLLGIEQATIWRKNKRNGNGRAADERLCHCTSR